MSNGEELWNDYMNDLSDPKFVPTINEDVKLSFMEKEMEYDNTLHKEHECPLCEAGHTPTTMLVDGGVSVGGIAVMGSIGRGRGAGKTNLLRAHLAEADKPKGVLIVGAGNNEAHSTAMILAEKLKDTMDLIVHVEGHPIEVPAIHMDVEVIDIERLCVPIGRSEVAISLSSIETRMLKCIKEPPMIYETSTNTSGKSYHKFLPDVRGNNRRKKGKK